jgi:hypothetical protein
MQAFVTSGVSGSLRPDWGSISDDPVGQRFIFRGPARTGGGPARSKTGRLLAKIDEELSKPTDTDRMALVGERHGERERTLRNHLRTRSSDWFPDHEGNGLEIFDVDEKPLAFVYSQRKGIEILQRRDIGKTRPPGGGRISHAIMHLEIVEVDRQLTRRYVASVPHCWVM